MINLGVVTPQPIGEWDSNTYYKKLNIVRYIGSSYMAKKDVPIGIAPTNSDYFMPISNTFLYRNGTFDIGKTFRYVGTIGANGASPDFASYDQGWIEYTRTGTLVRGNKLYGCGKMDFALYEPSAKTSSFYIVVLPNAQFSPMGGQGFSKRFNFVIPSGNNYKTGYWNVVYGVPTYVSFDNRGNTCQIFRTNDGNIYIRLGYFDKSSGDFGVSSQSSVFSGNVTAVFGKNIYIEEEIGNV